MAGRMHTTKKRNEKRPAPALAAIVFYNLNKPHTILHKCHVTFAKTTCLNFCKVLEFMDDCNKTEVKRYTNLLKLSSRGLV
jgi:hypothetical protein